MTESPSASQLPDGVEHLIAGGDRLGRYLREGEADRLIASALPSAAIVDVARIRPWRNNFAMLIRP